MLQNPSFVPSEVTSIGIRLTAVKFTLLISTSAISVYYIYQVLICSGFVSLGIVFNDLIYCQISCWLIAKCGSYHYLYDLCKNN